MHECSQGRRNGFFFYSSHSGDVEWIQHNRLSYLTGSLANWLMNKLTGCNINWAKFLYSAWIFLQLYLRILLPHLLFKIKLHLLDFSSTWNYIFCLIFSPFVSVLCSFLLPLLLPFLSTFPSSLCPLHDVSTSGKGKTQLCSSLLAHNNPSEFVTGWWMHTHILICVRTL